MSDAQQTTVELVGSVEHDGDKYDVWTPDGSLDSRLYVSQFAEDDVRPVEDEGTARFIRSELE